MTGKQSVASIQDQADLLEYLLSRTTTLDGTPVAGCWIKLDADEIEGLKALSARLYRMAPHEDRIRRIVTGR